MNIRNSAEIMSGRMGNGGRIAQLICHPPIMLGTHVRILGWLHSVRTLLTLIREEQIINCKIHISPVILTDQYTMTLFK